MSVLGSRKIRRATAIAAGRLAAWASRAARAGGGTTLPGRLAMGMAPGLVADLATRLPRGVVLVSGTNGKTTTARLLGGILEAAGLETIHNRAGANLLSGIASALIERASPGGRVDGTIGLFEVDEATLPGAVEATRPGVVILLNLFRDQLDRYGEIDLVAERWRRALAAMPQDATLVYNGDDPLVADVGGRFAGRTLIFGLEEAPEHGHEARTLEHAADARYCYRCGRLYEYTLVTLGHMGRYRCPQCGVGRPAPHVRASGIRLHGADGSSLVLAFDGARLGLTTVLPGLYNVYDVTAAAAGAMALEIDAQTILRGIEATAPAFGRGERVIQDGREMLFLLAKNPAGFNEVLRTVLLAAPEPVVLIAINDLVADGRDISWLWDVDFEMLRDRARAVVVTGLRAEEMALRLKYAGVAPDRIVLDRDGARAMERARGLLRAGERLYILPTYTAMLHLRAVLARKGYVRGFWKQ
ncbi:MAG: MurT ligase domain-containing protein [Armatimonadota bacterium]|nr:MurT ligase domain-containing protein [Armatimonadota bacterium]